MFLTLCYVYMWVRFHKCYSALIRNNLSRPNSSSFSFIICSSSAPAPSAAPLLTSRTAARPCPGQTLPEDVLFLQLGDRAVYVTKPQVLKWSDYCLPLACSPGQPFRAVAQATVENFSQLGIAFMEDRLQLDNGLLPSKIVPVVLRESTLWELLKKQCCSNQTEEGVPKPLPCIPLADYQHKQCCNSSFRSTPEARSSVEKQQESEPFHSTKDPIPVGDLGEHFLSNQHHMEGHGNYLHLSSCHECLEMENSTILSVKYASAENIPDLPNDSSVDLDSGDEKQRKPERDAEGIFGRSTIFDNGKPPNVLVYTNGCQERYHVVHQLLLQCINLEKYIIYPLKPQEALSDPWLDNTRLLVLAEEETLTPQLQTRFLTYLSQGGKVLGLGSTLCPAGLCLEVGARQRRQVSRLTFTKEDSTELVLSVLATGKVYTRDTQGGGEVELWGELKGEGCSQKDMVIVKVTHGSDGGEAVLCQVYLEIATENMTSEGFAQLRVSNTLRYEVLAEILVSLGLSCEPHHTPALSPVHLLATSLKAKASFLKWAETHAEQNALLAFSKATLRMVSSNLHDAPLLPEGSLALVTDSADSQSWPQFSMETYSKNLKTSLLGHIVLYADIITSTMNLLEGLNLKLPMDMGLIAVAGQQSQGRGRGRNAWLSPLGCAMFTLKVQVDLNSRLGQRIPFLQHLAALAMVEAVRTLPGYQDIELRVKWPNDIYYSNLMKLGGVLVTSTLIGSTFHLLIGCGFNVTNSNPTICINDLILQYNKQHNCSLRPLSCAQLIARTVNCLEELISNFQRKGPDAILPTYYMRWLHSATKVHLWSEDGPEAEVVGLDDNGFLRVHSKEHGVVSVEPDGNSFDMLKNLVIIKQH
uniref:BPL/LPL catalytic domain-containing protein n=1 Tax=Echeneis naucrates TaxID=173247 RepID=A0A665TP00_ECHNA